MRKKLLPIIAATAVAIAGLSVPLLAAGPAQADITQSGGDFVRLTNIGELADTRDGTNVPKAPMTAKGTLAVPVLGHGGVPSTGVSAVMVDLIGAAPTANTFLGMYPDGTTYTQNTSNLNIVAGTALLTNTAVVQVGADGKIAIYNSAGTINVAVNVLGYYTTSTAASGPGGFVPVYYRRVLDTRAGTGAPQAQIAAGGTVSFTVTGGSVPTTADSVYLDIIVCNATKQGTLSEYPYGGTTSAHNVMSFNAGTCTSHNLVVKPASGKITMVNHSTAPIDLIATQEAYTTNTSNSGSGFHATRQRIVSAVNLSPNATVVVPIAGLPGLPTQGLVGAAINMSANTTGGSALEAWGTGNTQPNYPSLIPGVGVARAGLSVVAIGNSGSITIRNGGTGSTTVWVDLEGWFSDQHTDLAPTQFAPTVALQLPASGTAAGAIEYAYVDNIGQLHTGFQASPDDFSTVSWKTVSGLGDIFSGQPTLNLQPDQSLAASAQYRDSGVRTITEPSASASSQNWSSFFDTGGTFTAPPSSAQLGPGGALYSFATDSDGVLWTRSAGTTTAWVARSTTPSLTGTPTVMTTANGIQVFALTTAGTVVTASYQGAGSLSAWVSLGGTGVIDRPAVAIRPGYLMQVVIRQGDGSIATKAQASNGSYPSAWSPVGTFNAIGAPAAVLDPVSGQIEILARSADDKCIYNSGETVQGSQIWRNWAMASTEPSATDPTITTFTGAANGDGWLAPFRTPQNGTRVITEQSGSAFAARRPSFMTRTVNGR